MLITIILTLAGLALGAILNDPIAFALMGLLLGRVIALQLTVDQLARELARLRDAMVRDWDARHIGGSAKDVVSAQGVPAGPEPASDRRMPPKPDMERAPVSERPAVAVAPEIPGLSTQKEKAAAPAIEPVTAPVPANPAPVSALIQGIRGWLASGNLFVRVGILLLFLGVGFLINYAVDREILVFTPEMRLAGVAAGGALLLLLGWIQRGRRPDLALLLQGAGLGILYLDIYGAYQIYQLIPAATAFALLLGTALAAALLAILQDARALAWFGFAGGYLAPILAAGGSDDPVVLFSYYALLNASLLAVAWFKSWRALNLLGFVFTYGVAGAWGVLRYEPSRFAVTEPFLVLFFLFFVAIAVLYAVRQPPRFRGYLDATLVFGTPILTFGYQVQLIRDYEYGIAWSSAAMGIFYCCLFLVISRAGGKGLRLLAQAFLALGLVFLSLAIPFALGADQTATAWALEGAGLIWIGSRQQRVGARAFGLLLQAGAAAFLLMDVPDPGREAFLNGSYLGAAMTGIGGVFSAYWMDREYPDKRVWEQGGAILLLIWGLAWWLGAGGYELEHFFPRPRLPVGILAYSGLTVLVIEAVMSRFPWGRLHRVQSALPLAGLLALVVGLGSVAHPAAQGGAWAWPAFLATVWLVLFRIERRDPHPSLAAAHVAAATLLAAFLELEITWRLIKQAGWTGGWEVAAYALVPVAMLQLVTRAGGWPIGRWRFSYTVVFGALMAVGIALWAIVSVDSPGDADPFRWLPVLNPLDVMTALGVVTLFQWWSSLRDRLGIHFHPDEERLVWALLGALAFLWLNLALMRAMHHWWGIEYAAGPLLRSHAVQMAMSVLWGLAGVVLLLAARVRASRGLWISGAVILAAVVVKLLLVDLAARGTLERVVSFLAIGILLVGIGWFSPLPPKEKRAPGGHGESRLGGESS